MKRAIMAAFVLAAATVGAASFAAEPTNGPADGPPPSAMQNQETSSVAGTVQGFNYGPRGVEGIMVSADGKVTQINFGPDLGGQISQSVAVGDQIKATVRPDNGPPGGGPGRGPGARRNGGGPANGPEAGGQGGPGGPRNGGMADKMNDGAQGAGGPPPRGDGPKPDHAVMRLVSLTDAKGKEIHAPSPEDRKAMHVEGSVKALNYDPRGTVNGAQLDNGDVVRMSPQDAKVLELAAGKKLTVDGVGEKMSSGGNMIEANTVNGITVHAGGPGGPRGPRGGGQGGPRGGGPDGAAGNGPPPGQ